MRILPILQPPAAALRAQCSPAPVGASAAALAMDMLSTMYAANGRGLAAPQVGETLRVFVLDCAWKERAPEPRVFLNPEIVEASEEMAVHTEECLSLPGQPVSVARPLWVRLAWQGFGGAAHEARFEGIEAVCVQHELDHLNGVLITDKAA